MIWILGKTKMILDFWNRCKNNKKILNMVEKVTFIARILFAFLVFLFITAIIYSAYKL